MFWACKLQTKVRWGWSNCSQSYLLSLTSVISTSAARTLMLTAFPFHPSKLDFSPFMYPGSSGKCTNECMRVSYSHTLVESHLSDARAGMDNLHFVALPQSYSSMFVPLGWWWCTWPAWPAQAHRDESSLSEQWEKVGFGGGLMSIWSAGFSWGRKGCLLQFDAQLHTVPSSTNPSPFSSPCRHQL